MNIHPQLHTYAISVDFSSKQSRMNDNEFDDDDVYYNNDSPAKKKM